MVLNYLKSLKKSKRITSLKNKLIILRLIFNLKKYFFRFNFYLEGQSADGSGEKEDEGDQETFVEGKRHLQRRFESFKVDFR
jgi:poly(A) polymerase Pap1